MTSSEVRKNFLDFFAARGHAVIPSASLVPEGDTTTLFTGSGMQPLIKYLLGEPHPQGKRLVNSQKSFRAEDVDEVGDNRHTVFFEMLGNWSLGDYFKKEQLPWIFEFLTDVVGLDPKKIYVSVFSGAPEYDIPQDDESVAIWQELFKKKGIEAKAVFFGDPTRASEIGMQPARPDDAGRSGGDGRIFYYNAKKNWWSRSGPPEKMPAREPGGPDSEVFFDFGTPHDAKFGKECHPNCDCGRFMEIGNSVFMEYKKTEAGTFEKLAQRNVDFGGGLERITAASQNDPDMFNIDILRPLTDAIRAGAKNSNVRSERIIADHVRAAIFLIADGVVPSNKDRGYLLRRLIRRAVTHGHYIIGLPAGFLDTTIDALIDSYGSAYSELPAKRGDIKNVFGKEQAAFEKTYNGGIKEFEKVAAEANNISGAAAFTLLATFGFPIELTEELAAQRGKAVDRSVFDAEMEKHRELSRAGSESKFGGHGLYLKTGEVTIRDESEVEKVTRYHTATHLLHAALRAVLGPEVQQDGSDITIERTRFDFRFPRKVTPEEQKKVEEWVSDAVKKDLTVKWEEMSFEEATKQGALGFFREKYPPRVKVYTVADPKTGEVYSKELCGGPHVEHTGTIGTFKITKEESSSAGVRRIRGSIEP